MARPRTKKMYYLYWDESDENDPSISKIRRAAYTTLEEAEAQRDHDLMCLRCSGTGDDPLGIGKCQVCGGSGQAASKNHVCIEESNGPLGAERDGSSLERGTVIWER